MSPKPCDSDAGDVCCHSRVPPPHLAAGATYIFCLPGSPGACRDAWDEILVHQLDYRYRPCNFVELMPRLDEHLRRAKAKGATV